MNGILEENEMEEEGASGSDEEDEWNFNLIIIKWRKDYNQIYL